MIKCLQLCCLLAFLPVLGLAACSPGPNIDLSGSSSSSNTPVVIDLTGNWAGTWTSSTGASGSFTGAFNQVEPIVQGPLGQGLAGPEQVGGIITFQGSPCFTGLGVQGSASVGNFTGAPTFRGDFIGNSIEIRFVTLIHFQVVDGNPVGFDSISGTYEVMVGGVCTGETGTLSATNSTLIQGDAPRMHEETVHEAGGTTTIWSEEPGPATR